MRVSLLAILVQNTGAATTPSSSHSGHSSSLGRSAGGRAARTLHGAFRFEPVEGAAANDLPGAVPPEVKEERYARVMELTARISAEKLAAKVGRSVDVIIDVVDGETGGATGRSKADAPEIDGEVHLRDAGHLAAGDIVRVTVEDSDEHDLFGVPERVAAAA